MDKVQPLSIFDLQLRRASQQRALAHRLSIEQHMVAHGFDRFCEGIRFRLGSTQQIREVDTRVTTESESGLQGTRDPGGRRARHV